MIVREQLPRDVILKCTIRDKGICQKCNKNLLDLETPGISSRIEFHHIIPVFKGGDHSVSNIITLCHDCHMELHADRNGNRMKLVSGNRPNDAIKVSLPKDKLKQLGWNKGDMLEVSVIGKKQIVLEKVRS